MNPEDIKISDYTYTLPAGRIAQYPLDKREHSKLLIYNKGKITEDIFSGIPGILPESSLLVFNNTKVVNARLKFTCVSGKEIEIFCLEPSGGGPDIRQGFLRKGEVSVNALIGNLKAWKSGILKKKFNYGNSAGELFGELTGRHADSYTVRLSWLPCELTFAEILESAGEIPLPPYIKRKSNGNDLLSYQTVYAGPEGSVAAPTAGLHFTDSIMDSLTAENIQKDFVTLHVGAGTFKPVKSEIISGHEMHSENFYISLETIGNIYNNLNGYIVPVGTTSLRTIESVYRFGVQLAQKQYPVNNEVFISQWEPYNSSKDISAEEAFESVMQYLGKNNLQYLNGRTNIIIVPGYKFKAVKGLITNFHQPGSTLLLLIAAFLGNDWKRVYDYALLNDFRFLSYGDSSILLK